MKKNIPVYILSGFLGSGKTTLLKKLADHYLASGLQPAVVINEIGDVNFDKLLIDEKIPMEELLSGCICCTASGDLGVTVKELIENYEIDVILIEATGAANPVEIFDAVTEASLFQRIDLKSMITVVDSPYYLELSQRDESNKTVQLMQEQIRYSSVIILNKMDLIDDQEKVKLHQFVREYNRNAEIIEAVYCDVDIERLNADVSFEHIRQHDSDHSHHHDHDHHDHMHHSHAHVSVYTHYFDKPIDREKFLQMMNGLPKSILRAKGILRFHDKEEQYLLQYAYYRVNLIGLGPQTAFPEVLVLIGESIPKEELKQKLEQL